MVGYMQNGLSNLTIVIPTYNRHEYAARVMQYWSGSEATVIILDGSTTPVSDDTLNSLGPNVHYSHLPELSIFDRLVYVFGKIQTDFVVLHGDDEFLLSSGLEACVQAFSDDSGLVACMGRALNFNYANGRLVGKRRYDQMIDHQVDREDPFERLDYHLSQYACSTCYAVCRTAPWVNAFKIACTQISPVYGIGELQYEATMAFSGRGRVINQLMWLRSGENPSVNFFHNLRFQEFWTRKRYRQQKIKFCNELAASLAKIYGYQVEKVQQAVVAAFDRYLHFCKLSGRYVRCYAIKKVLKKIAPGLLQALSSTGKSNHDLAWRDIRAISAELETEGVEINHGEFEAVLNIIENFHTANLNGSPLNLKSVVNG